MKLHRPAHLAATGPPAAARRGPGHGSVGETSQTPLGGKKPSPSSNAPRPSSSDIGGSLHPASGARPGESVAASGASPPGETTVSAQAGTALHSISGHSGSTASTPSGASARGNSRAPHDPAAPGKTRPSTRGKAAAAATPTPPPAAHEGPASPGDLTVAAWLPATAPSPSGASARRNSRAPPDPAAPGEASPLTKGKAAAAITPTPPPAAHGGSASPGNLTVAARLPAAAPSPSVASARGNSRAPPDPAIPGAPTGISPHLPGGHRPGPARPRGVPAPHAWSSSSSSKSMTKTFVKTSAGGAIRPGRPPHAARRSLRR